MADLTGGNVRSDGRRTTIYWDDVNMIPDWSTPPIPIHSIIGGGIYAVTKTIVDGTTHTLVAWLTSGIGPNVMTSALTALHAAPAEPATPVVIGDTDIENAQGFAFLWHYAAASAFLHTLPGHKLFYVYVGGSATVGAYHEFGIILDYPSRGLQVNALAAIRAAVE